MANGQMKMNGQGTGPRGVSPVIIDTAFNHTTEQLLLINWLEQQQQGRNRSNGMVQFPWRRTEPSDPEWIACSREHRFKLKCSTQSNMNNKNENLKYLRGYER